jgi:restriction endonuclease S subunit
MEDIQIKSLGEVCNIENGNIIDINNIGEYPVYGNYQSPIFYTNSFNREGYNVLISKYPTSPEFVRVINHNAFLNDKGISIKPNTDNLLHKYLGYYLLNNQKLIYNSAITGSVVKFLSLNTLKLLKIPIPSIQKQEDIINKLDIIDNINKDIIKLIKNLKELKTCKINNSLNTNIEFGEMFNLIRGTIQNSKVIENINGITFISASKECKKIELILNNTIISGSNLFISITGNKTNIKYYDNDCYYSSLMGLCKIKDTYIDRINIKYIYYYLLEKQNYIQNNYLIGVACKRLNIEQFNLMQISLPSIEIQNDIVNYCDNNIALIQNLNNTIDENKKIMQNIINNI